MAIVVGVIVTYGTSLVILLGVWLRTRGRKETQEPGCHTQDIGAARLAVSYRHGDKHIALTLTFDDAYEASIAIEDFKETAIHNGKIIIDAINLIPTSEI